MRRRSMLAVFFLTSLLIVARAAQRPSDSDEPVWTMDVLKVQPGMFGATLGYLDNNWMRVRAEAKRQGAVLTYHRIADGDDRENGPNIILLTEFKNAAAYKARERLFSSILKQMPDNGSVMPLKQSELYDIMSTRSFQDYSDMDRERLRLLSKK